MDNPFLDYIITHIVSPLQLPEGDGNPLSKEHALIGVVADAVRQFVKVIPEASRSKWLAIATTLDNLGATVRSEELDQHRVAIHQQLTWMQPGDVCPFFIRAQNAAVVFRKEQDSTVYSAFEVSPKANAVVTTQGKLICSYPGPAIEIPNAVFDDAVFQFELANFLVCMNEDVLGDSTQGYLSGSPLSNCRDTTDPKYITELLTGILRGVGRPATGIVRITKRIGDDVVVSGRSQVPWRRSSVWLVIRVLLQTTLESFWPESKSYKIFIVFFLCKLARAAVRADLSNDLLHAISAKISRRLRKLGASVVPEGIAKNALKTCECIRNLLDERWLQVQDAQRASPPHAFSGLDLTRDAELSLLCSREYLGNRRFSRNDSPPLLFRPQHHPRFTLNELLSLDGPSFEDAFRADLYVALYDIEQAVEQGIDAWVADIPLGVDEACVQLEVMAKEYSSAALIAYAGNPEQLSVMLLTTLELWVALDKIATEAIPLLTDFSPEIPVTILEKLLLREASCLCRLRHIYEYLHGRHSQCHSDSSVFSADVSEDTFAVRYYKESPTHQNLRDQIEEDASGEVTKKLAELKNANREYAKLKLECDGTEHVFFVWQDGTRVHSWDCHKCGLERELRDMKIEVYQWPLPDPDDELHTAIIVFELKCPLVFNMWRSITFDFLLDICSESPQGNSRYLLKGDPGLTHYFVEHPRSRITLGSSMRPTGHKLPIPAKDEEVIVSSRPCFQPFDRVKNIPAANAFKQVNVGRYCTCKIPEGPYHNLQRYVDATSHTSNEILADQADCHGDLSVHEFIAFGHLRSGGRIQWINVLRALRERALSFCHPEVHLLLVQASTQVGSLSGTGKPKWHAELQEASFGHALINELETLVVDVQGNWLERITLNTASFLLGRLLAANPCHTVSCQALALLRLIRTKVFTWVRELLHKLATRQGDEELRGLLRDTAAICRSTFSVDRKMLPQLLSSAEDIEVLVSCAIVLHDNTPSKTTSLSAYSRLLLERDRCLSLVLEQSLSDIIPADADHGINLAIRNVWPDYRPDSRWTSLPHPNSRWFSCMTASTTTQCSQVVHFNLLDGSLLVDGKLLGRLPGAIIQHPLYNLVFSGQVLDVIPGDLPGMDYSTRGTISNHNVKVSFALRGKDLVIRAKRVATDDSDVFELIPRKELADDLPAVLVEGHAHWLNLSTSVMEIRPFDKLWEASPNNWNVDCTPGRYCMRKGRERLLDIRSNSWQMVSALFVPFDISQNLLVSTIPIDSNQAPSSLQLSVALPRYGLSFYVDDDGDLQSHNIRGMVYDKDQSIGALFGLVNRLVLRPKPNKNIDADDLVPRCVIIPEGAISFKVDGHHARVDIDTSGTALRRIGYQIYRIDTNLGCLTGNVSLTNKLYRAYLHALTSSGCNQDPLTGRSGTEEALGILHSAGCWSIMKFSSRDAELLCLIASLCPLRSWQNSHLKDVQVVPWLNIPTLSQDEQLYVIAKAIRDHVMKLRLFHEGWETDLINKFPLHDNHLLARSSMRAAYLLPSNTCKRPPTADCDVTYLARDILCSDSLEHRVYSASATIFNWSVNETVITVTKVTNLVSSWKETMNGTISLSLTYNSSWLNTYLPRIWIKLYNLLRSSQKDRDRFKLLFSLSAMAYSSSELSNIVPTLMAFAFHPPFRLEYPPAHPQYNLSDGYQPSQEAVSRCITAAAKNFDESPEALLPARRSDRSYRAQVKYRMTLYDARLKRDGDAIAAHVFAAWPSRHPPVVSLNATMYDSEVFNSGIRDLFQSCNRNVLFWRHICRVDTILCDFVAYRRSSPMPFPRYRFDPAHVDDVQSRPSWSVTLDQLILARPSPLLQACEGFPKLPVRAKRASSSSGAHKLQPLISSIQADPTAAFQQYASDLGSSVKRFSNENTQTTQVVLEEHSHEAITLLVEHYNICRNGYQNGLSHIKEVLGPNSVSDHAFERSGQWPRITAEALFRCISSTSLIRLTEAWRKSLVKLALLMLELRRAQRVLRLAQDGFHEEFYKELENGGFDGWDPEDHPDWVLIQLQGNFLIRHAQVDVVNEMVSPLSKENTAMQLNMGEGKSSVIVPISAAELADGNQLVRVVVPKALTAQMFQLLVDRLGGLANRRVYYLPFSRSLALDSARVASLCELLSECMRERGVLVVQPDHVLSLKLVSVEKQLARSPDLALPLLKLQKWLHFHARDILDESDEILHVRYQLVYTIGLQQHMEGFPERWTTTQQVLAAVKRHALSLRSAFQKNIEYESGPSGSFPRIRILQPDAGEALVSRIAHDALDGLLPNFNLQQLDSQHKDAVFKFITQHDIPLSTSNLVRDHARQTTLWAGLLLLRGILATNVLLFTLRDKRWRVDYGLALDRTMLAVPYRAKDVPSLRAEFGHPDVAIVLTCLSYYYGGLTEEQLKLTFEILLKEDDPSMNYKHWIRECPFVPDLLRSYTGINLKSSEQWTKSLVPLFSRNHATVDFFLARVVFPKEAKEFPSKLACSGWDLAEKKTRLVTGFSGTNDGRYLLPSDITQHDPDHQRGTNAKVLSYLLQFENNHYMCTTHESGERRTTVEFLKMLVAQDPEIRVLLDVGAQMLDFQNRRLVEEWLALSLNASAAIYFDDDDELTVLTRDGRTQLLLSSPFAQQLDQCIVYLDDAHTRGTDIRFPTGFRAGVTLGPKVTKDRLTQGCMRMRKLGTSHSVMFFAPLEVEWKIRALSGGEPDDDIHAIDILRWAIHETCSEIQQRAPQWRQQGTDHQARYDAWSLFCDDKLTPGELSTKWLQPEIKSLEELYAPHYPATVPEIQKRPVSPDVASARAARMDEEQEREVIHEVEREREVERPSKASPAPHSLSEEVVALVNTGVIPSHSNVFRPIFTTLGGTSAVTGDPWVWSRWVLATEDFCRTIDRSEVHASSKMDDYLRPVHWILSSNIADRHVLVVLSPFEVSRLILQIKRSKHVHLHVYTPRTTQSMKPSDDLRLYSMPRVPEDWTPPTALMDQLNVFAGQLYLSDHPAYSRLCRFLCLHLPGMHNGRGEVQTVDYDGFIRPEHRHGRALDGDAQATFQSTPLPFIKVLLGLRRKGMSFTQTHMGKLIEGRLLDARDLPAPRFLLPSRSNPGTPSRKSPSK